MTSREYRIYSPGAEQISNESIEQEIIRQAAQSDRLHPKAKKNPKIDNANLERVIKKATSGQI